MKRRHRDFGPKKIYAKLLEAAPAIEWPAVSTIGSVLARHGLVKPHKRRRKTPIYPHQLLPMSEPNAVWTADIKGQFRTQDEQLCYPLTIADGCSRFVLSVSRHAGFDTGFGVARICARVP